MPSPIAATTTDLAAAAHPPLDPAGGTIFRSGPVLNQHRSDRPSWHPDDCTGTCCWRQAQIGPNNTLARPVEQDSFLMRRLDDPVVEAHGFPVTGVYCETVLLPLLGPSSVLLLRRFGAWLAASPDGVQVDLPTLAGDLGLGRGTGRNSPIRRTISRLCQFHMAEWQGDALAVRTAVAPVSERQLARLSPGVVAVHRTMTRPSGRT
jgi:hypothetical protein